MFFTKTFFYIPIIWPSKIRKLQFTQFCHLILRPYPRVAKCAYNILYRASSESYVAFSCHVPLVVSPLEQFLSLSRLLKITPTRVGLMFPQDWVQHYVSWARALQRWRCTLPARCVMSPCPTADRIYFGHLVKLMSARLHCAVAP